MSPAKLDAHAAFSPIEMQGHRKGDSIALLSEQVKGAEVAWRQLAAADAGGY